MFIVNIIASISLRYYLFNFYCTLFLQFVATFPLHLSTLFATYTSHVKKLTYWHYLHAFKIKLPILFIYSISVRLYLYVNFLAKINADINESPLDRQVRIIAIEIISVSSRITYKAMLKEEMYNEIYRILTVHRWEKCILILHS